MKKRSFLLCALVLALMLAFAAPLSAAEFTDINEEDWFAKDVYALADKGLINGMTETTFEPQGNITRAQFCKILAYDAGIVLEDYKYDSNFADVRKHWAEPCINWAYENYVVNGRNETTFDPDGLITRQELSVMIVRYANHWAGIGLPPINEPIEFKDAAEIATWTEECIPILQQAGIINGYKDGDGYIFKPNGNATRAESAKLINTFLNTMTTVYGHGYGAHHIFDLMNEEYMLRRNVIFTEDVYVNGSNAIMEFRNCEFRGNIIFTADYGTIIYLNDECEINGNVVFKNNVKEASMDYNMPKVFSEANIRAIAENCIGTVVTFGGASLNYNGTDYTFADADYFEDAEGNILGYTGQEANSLYIGQWWENGEKFIFKLCFE